MPIDPSIALGVKPPQFESPINALSQALQIQGLQQQNALGQMKMDQARVAQERNAKLTSLLSSGAKAEDLIRGGFLEEGLKYQKDVRENAKTEADTNKSNVEAGVKAMGAHRDLLSFVGNPQQAAMWIQAAYTNPALAPIVSKFGSPEEMISRIPQDPQGFEQWKQQNALGADNYIKHQTTVAQQKETARHNQATEQTAAGQLRVSQGQLGVAQGNLGVRKQELELHKSQTAAAMSKPFEVTGADGNPVLVQQDKQGNIKPVEGYTPKGGTAKPLPQAVLKQITEVRDNAVTIDRLSSSFKKDYAGKGVLGMGGELQLSASGNLGMDKDAVEWWKNYRKQAELVERHSLFGAALTPNEQQSWRSADIGPGMNPDVVKRNLETRAALARKVFENTQQDLIDAGHSEKRISAISARGAKTDGGATGDFSGPAPGTVEAGYRFKGGNPADPKSWEKLP